MAGVNWLNSDGLEVRFNDKIGKRGNKTAVLSTNDRMVQFVTRIDLTGAAGVRYTADLNNDGVVDGFTDLDTPLPAGSIPVKSRVRVIVTPAGGTNYSFGTFTKAGAAVSAAGLLTTALADGALIGTTLAADGFLAATTTGTYTAGVVEIVTDVLVP